MEKDARYFIVGVFMSVAIAALVGFVIWLAGPHEKKDYVFYTVEFTDPVSGLEKGADVQYKGVKVGEVISMRLVPDCFNLIRVDIGINRKTPVRAHTSVTIETQGFAGSPRLEMSTDDTDADLPQKVAGEQYPLLEGTGSRLFKALADIAVITGQVRDITQRLDGTLDAPTLAAVQATIVNAQQVSKGLSDMVSPSNVAEVTMLVNNLSQASAGAPAVMDDLRRAARQAGQAAGGFNGILQRNRNGIDRFASQGLPDFAATAREAKGAAASVHKLSDKLGENPSQLIYQPSSSGVEIPK